jgi:hypothetical protein
MIYSNPNGIAALARALVNPLDQYYAAAGDCTLSMFRSKGAKYFAEWVAQSDWNTVYFKCPNSEVRIRALAGPAYLKD